MGKRKDRVSTEGSTNSLDSNPFGALDGSGLPQAPKPVAKAVVRPVQLEKKKSRGRIDVRREKAGRGGKTVTVLSGEGLNNQCPAVIEKIAKTLKGRFATGGVAKGKTVELQGDHREAVKAYLENEGYRVVFTGG